MNEVLKTTGNNFPPGWGEERVLKVLEHYESQTEDEAIAEIKAAFDSADYSVMLIPKELVPAVRTLLSQHSG